MKTLVIALSVIFAVSCLLAYEPMFNTSVNYQTGRDYHFQPAVADLNGDGYLDLAVGVKKTINEYDSLSVLFNTGDGSFQTPVRIPVGKYPEDITLDDFDNDSDIDIAVLN